jgi:hypothetical protein
VQNCATSARSPFTYLRQTGHIALIAIGARIAR